MAVLLAAIVCPIVFGLLFILQTGYFLYKLLKCRQVDRSGEKSTTTISISNSEAVVCLGWIWTSCIDKRTGRMSLKAFIAWYIVALCADILVTLLFYVSLYYYNRVYV